jgi:hypothetical protein
MEQVERIASVQSRDAHLMASRYFRNEPTLIRPKSHNIRFLKAWDERSNARGKRVKLVLSYYPIDLAHRCI